MRHRTRGPALLAILLSLLTLAAPLAAQRAGEAREERLEVTDIDFEGVESVDVSQLREAIAIEASNCRSVLYRPICWITHSPYFYEHEYLDRTELARDLLRIRTFYWRRGFREAEVDTVLTRTGDGEVRVTFRVEEGQPTLLDEVRVVGPDTILPERAVERLERLAGAPFNILALDSALVGLRNALFERGYADAEVTDTVGIVAGRRRAELVVAVEPGRRATVDSIVIRGNEEISGSTIRRSIALREGQIFRRGALAESQRNLYQSNLFRSAIISVPQIPANDDSAKTIVIEVVEAPLYAARAATGVSNVDFAQVEASWTSYNFLGRARRLQLLASASNLLARQLQDLPGFLDVADLVRPLEGPDPYFRPNWQLTADFNEPWFLSYRNTLGAGLFAHRRAVPGVYIDRGYGATATFTREVAPRAPVSLVYRYEVTRIERAGDVYFCVVFGVCDEQTIAALRRNQALSPLSLTGFVNRTNDVFSPTAGYRAEAGLEHASAFTGSDFRYNRVRAEGALFRDFGDNVLAVRAKVGWVESLGSTLRATGVEGLPSVAGDIVHPRKRFYSGGSQSVRGFGENQLGPRVLTIAPEALPEGCLPPTEVECDLADDALYDELRPRPIGGTAIVEGSVEYRVHLWRDLYGAMFVDGALLGSGGLTAIENATGAITPGVGIRYVTPVGPIRVDIGWRPQLTQVLPVYTQAVREGRTELVRIGRREYQANEGGNFFDQLAVHFAIGQAF